MNQKYTQSDIVKWLKEYYNIDKLSLYALEGEVDDNWKVECEDEAVFLLKIAHIDRSDEVDFQVAVTGYLSEQQLPFEVPHMVLDKDERVVVHVVSGSGISFLLRMQTWVSGHMLSTALPKTRDLFVQWGQVTGYLTKALEGFEHPYVRRVYSWDPSQCLRLQGQLDYIPDARQHDLAASFLASFEASTYAQLEHLRQGVNYNDAHGQNLLTRLKGDALSISGVIDFGDVVYTHTINDVAIACAYAGMDQADPIESMCQVLQGYHQIYPLEERELAVLYSMITARLLTTAIMAAKNLQEAPDNAYLQVSADPAWKLLFHMREISPRRTLCFFRHACGYEACEERSKFDAWARQKKVDLAPMVQCDRRSLAHLDLDVGSTVLGANRRFESLVDFEHAIRQMLSEQKASTGIGGYDEVRPFYTTEAYKTMGNDGSKWRTVHLGVDIWAAAGSPVYMPIDGMIHAIQDNTGERNYGPTIIVRHEVSEGFGFYALYGHLSKDTLKKRQVGQLISRGVELGRMGDSAENGGWPPHVHFQIILDMLDYKGDFPGVVFPSERAVWKSICPDPRHLLHETLQYEEVNRLSKKDILELRRQHLSPNLTLTYENPLHIVRASGVYLYDADARRYLDTVNNVPHVGHQHPRVSKIAREQHALLNTNTRYLHEQIVLYARDLQAKFPDPLNVVFFVNSGTEANELALRLARTYTGQQDTVAIEVGYHGNSQACIDVSSYKFDGKGGSGLPAATHLLPLPDTYRGLYQHPETSGVDYATHAQEVVNRIVEQVGGIAGFIGESIMSCGGQIVPPEGYFQKVYELIRAAGGLCIADEVQVGFGRIGSHFWGFELHDVVPDIVVLGKPMGNGHPLGAVVTSMEIAEAFSNGMEYFNTFGGNAVSCVIGREVLRIIEDEDLQENASEVGLYLARRLQQLQKDFPIIGDVRGHGLFVGVELVVDRDAHTPAPLQTSYIINRLRTRGVLMNSDGVDHNVLKIKPPLCFQKSHVDILIGELSVVLGERGAEV